MTRRRTGLTRSLAFTAAATLACILLDPGLLEAQSGRSPWLGFGLGAGAFSGAGGFAGHADVGLGLGRAYVAGRLAGVTDSIACCETTAGDRTDAAVLFGLQSLSPSRVLAIAAGPAYVRGQHLDGTTLGLGVEARLLSWGRRGIGPQLYAFANLNSKDSFFGATLGVRFGGR